MSNHKDWAEALVDETLMPLHLDSVKLEKLINHFKNENMDQWITSFDGCYIKSLKAFRFHLDFKVVDIPENFELFAIAKASLNGCYALSIEDSFYTLMQQCFLKDLNVDSITLLRLNGSLKLVCLKNSLGFSKLSKMFESDLTADKKEPIFKVA